MQITSGFKKLVPSILSGAVGIALAIYGFNSKSSIAQILGFVVFAVSMVIMYKTRQRIACDIENV